jgi:uncharacterized alpha-E superfamily protein
MLSRTAEQLYWTARYFERAETAARLMEMGYRMSMVPSADGGYESEWASVLTAAGISSLFEQYYDEFNESNVLNFLIFDDRNPSSIKNCIRQGRENARAARTALTSEVWETINYAYLRFQDLETNRRKLTLPELCDWVKRRCSTLRGTFDSTQLQDEGYDFFNLGYYVERADNTARMLDVKYYVLLPDADAVGGGVDTYQWFALLRALSARRAFHWVYNGDYSPEKIAHFLILNITCPRSLMHCTEKMNYHLGRLSRAYRKKTSAHKFADGLLEELGEWEVQDIIQRGLHEFLTEFIGKNARITKEISASYLFGSS